jgi:hypothetical protein
MSEFKFLGKSELQPVDLRMNRHSIPLFSLSLLVASSFIASGVSVTFQVDMSLQASLGNFTEGSDTVEVHGSFDNWGPGVTLGVSATNSSVYQGTLDISDMPTTQVQYKFVINRSGTLAWEDNGVGPNGAQNRSFTIPDTATTLPLVYFNNQSAPPGTTRVTFQVDMQIQKAMGNFDPANHMVEAHGSFDNWGPGIALEATSTNENVYRGTAEITGSLGVAFEHKFVINKSGTLAWEGTVGSGGGNGNRIFTLTQSEQVLPVVYFDNLSIDPGAGVPVTFRVNMLVQRALGLFDPGSGMVNLAGPFNDWSTTETPLTNNAAQTMCSPEP